MPEGHIYHICRKSEWDEAKQQGSYKGSSQDAADGFIHFSTAEQLRQSAAKHRAGQDGLVLIAVNPTRLGLKVRWEPSRGGRLFPHLYGRLPVTAVSVVHELPLGDDGQHVFPPID